MHKLINKILLITMVGFNVTLLSQIKNVHIHNSSYLTKNTNEIISSIRRYTSKPISIESIINFPDPRFQNYKNYYGICKEKEDTIKIWIADDHGEQILIHELIHILLRYEGYPTVKSNPSLINDNIGITTTDMNIIDGIQSLFNSTIDHQVVYPRMKKMPSLKTEAYFKSLVQIKHERLSKKSNASSGYKNYDIFNQQQDLMTLFDLVTFGRVSESLINLYSSKYQNMFNYFKHLSTSIDKVGFSSIDKAKISANILLRGIIEYGSENKLDIRINRLWKYLTIN